MIDITKLTEEEINELRMALGVTRARTHKRAFFEEEIMPKLEFIPDIVDETRVKKEIYKRVAELTDFVTGNYYFGRRNSSLGCFKYPTNEQYDRYEGFANELCVIIKKYFSTEQIGL